MLFENQLRKDRVTMSAVQILVQMCAVAHAYASNQECSVQEAIYQFARAVINKNISWCDICQYKPSRETFKKVAITRGNKSAAR